MIGKTLGHQITRQLDKGVLGEVFQSQKQKKAFSLTSAIIPTLQDAEEYDSPRVDHYPS